MCSSMPCKVNLLRPRENWVAANKVEEFGKNNGGDIEEEQEEVQGG